MTTTSLRSQEEAAAAAAAEGETTESGGTATISNEIFNLIKGIVGAGVLSLPAGIAAYGNAPSAVLPASILIVLIGGLSGYGFSLIGRVCSFTGSKSYREAWSKSVGEETSWIPAVSCTLKTISAVLAYSMILADTTTSLLQTIGVTFTRTQSLLSVTGLILLPLCWLKNLSSLAPFSLLGSLGMVYTAIAMTCRCLGGAYAAKGGAFVSPLKPPTFGAKGASAVLSPNSFILISMLSTAYMSHFNAPKFYTELRNNTIPRFNTVVFAGFAASVALFLVVATMGFLTFGEACSGLILNNYANQDGLMSLSRIAVAVSIVFSFPLAFVGVREGVMDLFQIKNRTNKVINSITVTMLSIVTLLAMKIKDLSFVLAFAGATLGNALIYIYPALMFRGSAGADKATEVKIASATGIMGVGMGILGAKMALQSIM